MLSRYGADRDEEGLARDLGCLILNARHLMEDFMAMFPTLERTLQVNARQSALRGYATTVDSLRRHLPAGAVASRQDRNWMINHPVQGSAAVVFKAAGNRLHRLYQRYGARLIIPVHDAFVFEAPIDRLQEVAALTARVMCDTLQEYLPVLEPRAEVNIVRPECWNKDGEIDPLGCFIEKAEKMLKDSE